MYTAEAQKSSKVLFLQHSRVLHPKDLGVKLNLALFKLFALCVSYQLSNYSRPTASFYKSYSKQLHIKVNTEMETSFPELSVQAHLCGLNYGCPLHQVMSRDWHQYPHYEFTLVATLSNPKHYEFTLVATLSHLTLEEISVFFASFHLLLLLFSLLENYPQIGSSIVYKTQNFERKGHIEMFLQIGVGQ